MKYLLHDGVFAVLEVLKREALEARNNDNGNVLEIAILANYLISKTLYHSKDFIDITSKIANLFS